MAFFSRSTESVLSSPGASAGVRRGFLCNRRWAVGFVACYIVSFAGACAPNGDAERQALMDADRAFASATAERGLDGWMAFHLSDARNIPASGEVAVGHEAIAARMSSLLSDDQLLFLWEPIFADVSVSRDVGYTHGNWRLTRVGADSVEQQGRYLTVWRKDSDGAWKVLADIGNTRP